MNSSIQLRVKSHRDLERGRTTLKESNSAAIRTNIKKADTREGQKFPENIKVNDGAELELRSPHPHYLPISYMSDHAPSVSFSPVL